MLSLFLAVPSAAQRAAAVCPRPPIGGTVEGPDELRSANGKLTADFSFRTFVDVYGLTLYCYIESNTVQAPTLRLHPGEDLVLALRNELPDSKGAPAPAHLHPQASPDAPACGTGVMTNSSTNLHFHGMHVPPVCHQDDVIHTLVQPSSPAFEYRVRIPQSQSPGLYWYHPHPHGFTEAQVLGGASGALIVEGIERIHPEVAGLPERVLVLRDQPVPGLAEDAEDAGPGKDISLNFVPVMYPLYRPAEMRVKPEQREFWRVLNAAADTYFDLQFLFGATIQDVHIPQPLTLIATDGVPVDPQAPESFATRTNILLPPGARAEFLVTTPPVGTIAQLVTRKYDAGPFGAAIPYRAIANVRISADAPAAPTVMPAVSGAPAVRFSGLTALQPARTRKLYFSETGTEPGAPLTSAQYFITVDGAKPKVFDMHFKNPDLTVQQGTVEDWTIENRAKESHAFHIHQLHFQLLERDGESVNEPTLRDTVDLPYWRGEGTPYPTVKLRMDFRDPTIVGTFLYHCHILEHEDGGMMGAIQVVPAQ